MQLDIGSIVVRLYRSNNFLQPGERYKTEFILFMFCAGQKKVIKR